MGYEDTHTHTEREREREREREIKVLELSGWAHTFEGGLGGAKGNIRVCGVGRASCSHVLSTFEEHRGGLRETLTWHCVV